MKYSPGIVLDPTGVMAMSRRLRSPALLPVAASALAAAVVFLSGCEGDSPPAPSLSGCPQQAVAPGAPVTLTIFFDEGTVIDVKTIQSVNAEVVVTRVGSEFEAVVTPIDPGTVLVEFDIPFNDPLVENDDSICLSCSFVVAESDLGACCESISCEVTNANECFFRDGTFLELGTTCSPNPCIGACCNAGACGDEFTETECVAGGGSFQGSKSLCADLSCQPPGVCRINGLADFFNTPCDLSGTFATLPSDVFGIPAIGSDLTMERLESSSTVAELGSSSSPILQTRVLATYRGTLRVPILRFDSNRPIGEQVTATSRITYCINGSIEWREDVRGGTGRIEGGAWTPENPPDVDRTRVAGRAEDIRFEATLDTDSLPCCERVGVSDTRMSFVVKEVDEAVQTDLGLGRGLSFSISPSGSTTIRNCGTSSSCEGGVETQWFAPSLIVFDLGSVKPLIDIE